MWIWLLMWNVLFDGMVFLSCFGGRVDLDSPIPRPQSLEQLRCDVTKPYASEDICFSVEGDFNSPFSIEEIFGRSIKGACPISQDKEHGQVHVHLCPEIQLDPLPAFSSDEIAHYALTGKSSYLKI